MATYNYPPHVDELVHHGIKGQRWGVRRYQNEDGTLTEAGKRHKAKEYQKELNKLEYKQASLSNAYNSYNRNFDNRSRKMAKFDASKNEFVIDAGSKKVQTLMAKNEFASKRMDEIEKEFYAGREKMADLLNEVSRDPDLVWGTKSTSYYTRTDRKKDNKDSTYYNKSTATKYRVKSSGKDKNKRIERNQKFTSYTPIREEYYYY